MSYKTYILANDPIAYWRLPSGTDETLTGYDMVCDSVAVSSDKMPYADDEMYSSGFVANENCLYNVGNIITGLNKLLIDFWCKPDAAANVKEQVMVGRWFSAWVSLNNAMTPWQLNFRVWRGTEFDSGPNIIIPAPGLNDGEWHHIQAYFDNDTGVGRIRLYMDGVLLDTQTHTGTMSLGEYQPAYYESGYFRAGTAIYYAGNPRSIIDDYPYNGLIDEVALFDHWVDEYAGDVDFSANSTTIVEGSTISFTDLSEFGSSWLWNFGDGSTSTARNPTHTYTAHGTYTVTLTVNGSYSESKTGYITVTNSKIVLRFGSESVEINKPEYGYTVDVVMAMRQHRTRKGVSYWDNGSTYDYRVLKGFTSMMEHADLELLAAFVRSNTGGRGNEISIELDVLPTGFFPAGPDKGDSGTFKGYIRQGKRDYSLVQASSGGGLFTAGLEIVITDYPTPAYSLPAQVSEGPFEIAGITGLRWPEGGFRYDTTYALIDSVTNGGDYYSTNLGTTADRFACDFDLQANQSNMAALVDALITKRGTPFNIIAPVGYWMYGPNTLDEGLYESIILSNILSITHNRYDNFTLPMSVVMRRGIDIESEILEFDEDIIEFTDDLMELQA